MLQLAWNIAGALILSGMALGVVTLLVNALAEMLAR